MLLRSEQKSLWVRFFAYHTFKHLLLANFIIVIERLSKLSEKLEFIRQLITLLLRNFIDRPCDEVLNQVKHSLLMVCSTQLAKDCSALVNEITNLLVLNLPRIHKLLDSLNHLLTLI